MAYYAALTDWIDGPESRSALSAEDLVARGDLSEAVTAAHFAVPGQHLWRAGWVAYDSD